MTEQSALRRASRVRAYERSPHDPVCRPLRIFALDPTSSRFEGAVATVEVPYEPLGPGPVGALLEVDPRDEATGLAWKAVDLDRPEHLIADGRTPSTSDPQFHQQMVYAVASMGYAAFRRALGRTVAWGFDGEGDGPLRLRLCPHAFVGRNAFYDKERGQIQFGYYRADPRAGDRNLPGGFVFTCLSGDIILHEVTHALLDGLRAHFTVPSGPDTLAFHEGFADLVAILQHFTYRDVVRSALRRTGGRLDVNSPLTDLARQFGYTAGSCERPLRTALDPERAYDPDLESHELGSVLVAAIFDAFRTIYDRRIAQVLRLATGGTGLLPPGHLSHDLVEYLSAEATKVARQFLNICIRALDYCPPVDLEFGEYLRAVLTADSELVPEDPLGYREAWIDAFRRRGIHPRGVPSLCEDALLWEHPDLPDPIVPGLSFADLAFDGNPACPAGPEELERQAECLRRFIERPGHAAHFGLAAPGPVAGGHDVVDRAHVQSIRSSSRVGPGGELLFDQIAEVTQRRAVRRPGEPEFDFYGGATVVLGPRGEIRYLIRKSVLREDRVDRQLRYLRSERGAAHWADVGGRRVPCEGQFRLLHEAAQRRGRAVSPSCG